MWSLPACCIVYETLKGTKTLCSCANQGLCSYLTYTLKYFIYIICIGSVSTKRYILVVPWQPMQWLERVRWTTLVAFHEYYNCFNKLLIGWTCSKKSSDCLIMIIMKNFNRSSYHGHHGSKSKRSELAQHAHSRGSHTFTYTLISSYNHLVRSASSAITDFGGGAISMHINEQIKGCHCRQNSWTWSGPADLKMTTKKHLKKFV